MDHSNDEGGNVGALTAPIAPDPEAVVRHVWRQMEELGDEAGARAVAQQHVRILEEAAAGAPDPGTAAAFDWQRADAYLYLDRIDDAVTLLEARERELPEQEKPSLLVSRLHRRLRRWSDAASALDRAMQKVEVERRGVLAGEKAELLEEAGDLAAARDAAELAVDLFDSLPEAQRPPVESEAARSRFARLSG